MSTMKAWQLARPGAVESTLSHTTTATKPTISPKNPHSVIVKISHVALNPADHKIPEFGLISRLFISYPKIPGCDFTGTVEAVGQDVTHVQPGDRVVGWILIYESGTLAEYITAPAHRVAKLPASRDGVADPTASALAGTASVTALQCLQRNMNKGDKVFINGGSGGVGTMQIQIAKLLGASEVTVSCSTGKVDLCKSLGADTIIDYKKGSVVEELQRADKKYNLIIDNVGGSPTNLAQTCHKFTVPDGRFVFIGGGGFASSRHVTPAMILPGWCWGGCKRKISFFLPKADGEAVRADQDQLVHWAMESKLKVVISDTLGWNEAKEAFLRLKVGSSPGKVTVQGPQ